MSAHMKKRLTKSSLKILIDNKEVKLSDKKKKAALTMLEGLLEEDLALSPAQVFGKEINDQKIRIAKYLKGSRLKAALTQADVCRKTKIKQPNLSDYENAKKPPSLGDSKKLAKLYKCDVDILLLKKM